MKLIKLIKRIKQNNNRGKSSSGGQIPKTLASSKDPEQSFETGATSLCRVCKKSSAP